MREWELQQAIYAKLSADATLASLGAGVHDHTPQDGEYPYVVIGEDFAAHADTDSTLNADHDVTIHAWSRQRGKREVKQLQQACYSALHRQPLTISDATFVDCQVESSENFLDEDGLTRHGVQRFTYLLNGVT